MLAWLIGFPPDPKEARNRAQHSRKRGLDGLDALVGSGRVTARIQKCFGTSISCIPRGIDTRSYRYKPLF
jgi:hypothetical protein